MLCTLLSCLIVYNRFGGTVIITQHVDVLIVGFHEIPFTGNLLHRLRILVQLTYLSLISLVGGIVLVDFLLQLADTTLVLEVIPDTVLIEEAHDKHTQQTDQRIFQSLRTPHF